MLGLVKNCAPFSYNKQKNANFNLIHASLASQIPALSDFPGFDHNCMQIIHAWCHHHLPWSVRMVPCSRNHLWTWPANNQTVDHIGRTICGVSISSHTQFGPNPVQPTCTCLTVGVESQQTWQEPLSTLRTFYPTAFCHEALSTLSLLPTMPNCSLLLFPDNFPIKLSPPLFSFSSDRRRAQWS